MEYPHSPFARSPSPQPVVLLWSGGKDAVMALAALQEAETTEVAALLTTVAVPGDRVTMHGVPLGLVEAQAASLGLPLRVMRVPAGAPNDVYEAELTQALAPLQAQGVRTAATGDLYLADIRAYREAFFARLGMQVCFPLWGARTPELARAFIRAGYEAVLTSVDTRRLDPAWVGRPFDMHFLRSLPGDVDPCGEEGAFHTFVLDGPPFRTPVPISLRGAYEDGCMRVARLEESPAEARSEHGRRG